MMAIMLRRGKRLSVAVFDRRDIAMSIVQSVVEYGVLCLRVEWRGRARTGRVGRNNSVQECPSLPQGTSGSAPLPQGTSGSG